MDLTETRIASERIYEGRILNLRRDRVRLPDGHEASREVVEHPGAVAIIALDNDKNIYLVRQYRYPIERVTLEIPAGKLDSGEEPLTCAQRELAEEVGLAAAEWKPLLTFYSTPGFSNEIMHLFLATGLRSHREKADDDEFLEIVRVPLAEAAAMALRGAIQDAKSIAGIMAATCILQA
ncbi:NUDIX domain-containing protein [Neomoorella thermoacetica]|uniref:ADP-ribose pyrophosphatase n=3 Tax=Neomoorella thermoacetica TaxID=1525 RepID=A0A1D7XBE1_NEOTH|nr:NUDIX hydrolase [Moorella thermoacetica]AKX94287.1 ADP-ribose pyrophosphatase [Moorella thermoacetica]AKX96925.1 ADP-ribose pyrophosphatase [Moorella thermoacetica]AOQ24235.1 ADP-ribose pyrophosphatase [Moorella thermoacetica]OIQ11038.1 ADP-ribose pyrophosphatase [Moorella thermoacetica]OIQ54400.1 ADP-ribose pyrophosphatase [Moorella thermoacetica]